MEVIFMAVTKLQSLGEITSNFILNDFDVYLMNTSATGNYVSTDWAKMGYTSPEKTVNPIIEKYTREDKIPRVATYDKIIRFGLEIGGDISNQNADFEGMINQGHYTDLGASTGNKVTYGTDTAPVEYRAVRFSTKKDDGSTYAITIPKCLITQSGEKIFGGEKEVTTPLMFKAFYNPSANATGNLFYTNEWPSSISATADVPVGYA